MSKERREGGASFGRGPRGRMGGFPLWLGQPPLASDCPNFRSPKQKHYHLAASERELGSGPLALEYSGPIPLGVCLGLTISLESSRAFPSLISAIWVSSLLIPGLSVRMLTAGSRS